MIDPAWTDPALDIPFHCVWCGASGTREDVTDVWSTTDDKHGLLCSWCHEPNWED